MVPRSLATAYLLGLLSSTGPRLLRLLLLLARRKLPVRAAWLHVSTQQQGSHPMSSN